jgi:UDP-N-acetylmuramate-alanine ligase
LKIKSLCKTSRAKILEVTPKAIPFKHIRWQHNNINGSLTSALLEELLHTSKKNSNIQNSKLKIQNSLSAFKGLWRRMELLGENKNWTKIFSDYGHMASSLTLGYETLKEKFPKQKLICIFQPHQINRIVTWRNDFIQSTKGYDEVIIYDIYAARENLSELVKKVPALKGISTLKELGNKFAQACKGTYIDNFDIITKRINEAWKEEIVVIYSAGDIDFLLRKNPKIFK